MLLNCGEDSWEPHGLQRDKPINPKRNQSWIFIGRTDAETEAPILWSLDVKNRFIGKEPDARIDWRQEEKGDDRGWDGWMASPTQWTRVWASSKSWWWTGKPGVLQSMGSQRVGHDWATQQHSNNNPELSSVLPRVHAMFLQGPWPTQNLNYLVPKLKT